MLHMLPYKSHLPNDNLDLSAAHERRPKILLKYLNSDLFLLILMEAFHILSRGGARFDKNRFQADVELFTVSPTLG